MTRRNHSKPAPVAVVAAGVVCSVGLNAPAACAAIRASLDNFQETHFIDEVGQPIIGAMIPPDLLNLPEEADGSILGGDAKLARMFVRATLECANAAGGIQARETALFMLGPELDRPGMTPDRLQHCFTACEQALGHKFHPHSGIAQSGSPGLASALNAGRRLLREGAVRWVLIAGLDSLLNTEDINHALANHRLLTSDNSDGFIPGEAAACVLLARVGDVGKAKHQPMLTIAGIGLEREETDTLSANRPSRGVALAKAMRQALQEADMPAHAMHARYGDVSAESYFFEEAAYAWTRVLRAPLPEDYRFLTPVTGVGHIGAAMGPLMLALALDAARKGWAAGPHSLFHLSNSGHMRGAVVAVASLPQAE